MMSKIIIVEDNELHAETMNFYLDELGYKVLGIVDNGKDCIDLISENKPDILLLDININGEINGIQLAEKVKELNSIPLIFTTSLADRETLKQAIKTQPEAYLNKPIEKNALATAIEIALYKNKPENIISIHKSLIDEKIKELTKSYNLTIREIDLLLFLIRGYDNNYISENLFISVNTVKYHTRNLYEKLNVKTRAELTSIFINLK